MNIYRLKPLTKPVKAVVSIPGSKSYTNRALFLAAMCKHPVKISNALDSDDTRAMKSCLGKLMETGKRSYRLDANLSGTTIRFILALACTVPGVKKIYGAAGLNHRPISELVDGLRQLGAKIKYLGKPGYPPLQVLSSQLKSGEVKMDG